jgi:deoxyribose-phosphate aldolase
VQTSFANIIDHTLLKPNATDPQILQLCTEAKEYRFASVCINPCFVPLAARALQGTDVKVCTVIGFPLGASTTEAKLFEAKDAVANGADELDYVVNLSDVLCGRYDLVRREMERLVQLRSEVGKPLVIKIILETCYLNETQIVEVCKLAKETGLDFVKTSTGFGTAGATAEHVRIMRETVGTDVGVKASGGIRSYEDCAAMIGAGANRIGASASVAIVTGAKTADSSGY